MQPAGTTQLTTMLGATVLELVKNKAALAAASGPGAVGVPEIAIGFVVAFLVALVVVKGFVGIVTKHGFAPFACYRIFAGVAALTWLYA